MERNWKGMPELGRLSVYIQRFSHCFKEGEDDMLVVPQHMLQSGNERQVRKYKELYVSHERLIFVIIVKFFKSWYCYELHLNFECSMTCLLIHLLWFMLYVHFWIKVKFLLELLTTLFMMEDFKFWFLCLVSITLDK